MQTAPLDFRLATRADEELLIALMREFYAEDRIDFDDARVRRGVDALLADPRNGEVLLWLDEAGEVVGYAVIAMGFSLEQGGHFMLLDELYLDDTVDMIEEMPATVVKRILRNTDVETRASINTLLRYPEDSAGSIMTPEFVDLKRDMTVEDAFKRIRRTGVDKETIYTCYVTDASRHLLGVTTVKELLLHDQDDRIDPAKVHQCAPTASRNR